MGNPQENLMPNAKLTLVGRFVHWADRVEVKIGKKIVLLALLIGVFGFVVNQQNNYWEFFKVKKIAYADGDLNQMAPEKEIRSDNALRTETNLAKNKNIFGKYSLNQFVVKKKIEKLVEDKPMEQMIDVVAERDPETASYLVAIAKKESNLGKFSPKDVNGEECYNYWGFRGSGDNVTASGYTCFETPEDAVAAVGDRIQYLSQIREFDTPQKMKVWKCGFDCSWDNPMAVKKWVSDVSLYYDKINSNF